MTTTSNPSPSTSDAIGIVQKEIDLVVMDITERWKEVDQRDQQAGRFVPWLYVFLAALAGFVFSDSTDGAVLLQGHPYLLVILALILLWFPINSTVVWNDVLNCETYLRTHAYPRLARLMHTHRELGALAGRAGMPSIDPVWSVFDWKPFWHRSIMIDRRGRLPLLLWRVKDLAPHLPSTLLALAGLVLALSSSDDVRGWVLGATITLIAVYLAIHVAAFIVGARIGRLLHEASIPD